MLFYKISVFILKLFLAKIWRKLKAPGTSLKSVPGALQTPQLAVFCFLGDR